MDRLSDSQLSTFDREYVTPAMWSSIHSSIARDFPDGRFSFLDVGCGNGSFADRLLQEYPESVATVLDSSELLLAKNKSHPRKAVVLGDAMEVAGLGKRFDIIFCNLLLHHLITSWSFNQTQKNVSHALTRMRQSLSERGRLSICEHEYNGYIDEFPSRAIFYLTSSRLLAPIVKRLGANTAGVGVCFFSRKRLFKRLSESGFMVLNFSPNEHDPRLERKALLLIKSFCSAHYWAG